jgi:L-rhamnose isomerase
MGIKKEKTKQLGMDPGTASNRLKKNLLFEFAKRLDMHWCYQCGAEIEDCDKFTVEHKTPWLHSEDPKGLFFDIDNIAFSHKSCNYSAARIGKAKPCPSTTAYRYGCRCEGCKKAQSESRKKS